VAAATGMSPDEARGALGRIRQRVEAARDDPARAVAEARQGLGELAGRATDRAAQAAAQAQPAAARAGWSTFGVLLVSLLAALGGGVAGARGPTPRPAGD
jgi:CHASE3 domain sensor protein